MALEQTHWGGVFSAFACCMALHGAHGWIDCQGAYLLDMEHDPDGDGKGIVPPPPLIDKLKRDFRAAAERFARNSDAVARTARLFQAAALLVIESVDECGSPFLQR
ncbi:hypothetical protein TRIATDRAFT_159222 [Trichoderma atroviride IMI 206040]|uniref:Uncharacterized protein n=1 Tax=Hypocrea atroviridis (strain ATCC 20476 / IMI 206040) TaxID=452589 RepID=G9NUW9_HYPAI|nr:uncharacterized protein TRIATDRAFT_159222 [Trichoderma atroviride IMI 206040]EHK46213.1 hypothetical protein TRIATDRAFT_159222 [Trichoderma atroviride IMI 206040]